MNNIPGRKNFPSEKYKNLKKIMYTILITNDILLFIHNGITDIGMPICENIKNIRSHFIESLKNYNLEYTEIKYDIIHNIF